MPAKYPTTIPRDIRAKLIEYHQYQGDTNIKPVKTLWYDGVNKDQKYPAYLVRVESHRGMPYSCIDFAEPYVTEVESCLRGKEDEMVNGFVENWTAEEATRANTGYKEGF